MNSSPNTTPLDPSPMPSQYENQSSQKDVLSWLMSVASIFALGLALFGGTKLVIDVLGTGIENSLSTLPAKVMVVGLAYAVGWGLAVIAVRVFDNPLMPLAIHFFMVIFLLALCGLYALVIWKLFDQSYTTLKFWAYLTMLVAALAALVGLHLVFKDHNLRKFSYLLLFISLVHLASMVYRYVFLQMDAAYLWMDLPLFFTMGGSASLMLAHIGLLTPLRNQITSYISMNRGVLDD